MTIKTFGLSAILAATLIGCTADKPAEEPASAPLENADIAQTSDDAIEAGDRYGIVFLVRHAEKGDGADPDLTDGGWARAERLATELSDAGLDAIWSTDTTRTRQTAGKVAEMTGVPVTTYDADDVNDLVNTISTDGGTHLIVGHSNTIPPLVNMIADDPTPDDMNEGDEYDRLYTIQLFRTGFSVTDLERY